MVAWELYVKFYRTRDLLQFPRATPRYGKWRWYKNYDLQPVATSRKRFYQP